MTRVCRLSCSVAMLLSLVGCGGPPHVSKANVKLIEQLRTAVAAKKSDWLAQAEKQIEEHRRAGTLSGPESEAVQSIIDEARQGHWDEANRRMQWLVHGQQ